MKLFISNFFEIINIFLDVIYPENISCIICDNPIKKSNRYSICNDCFKELHFILDGCIKCGKPIINHSLELQDIKGCSYCFNKNFYFDKAISCIEYNEISKKMIFGLKYKNKTYMSKYISIIMKEKLGIENIEFDYILFVPLHKRRLRKRGFNQAEKIAIYLGKVLGVPVIDCIDRKNYTKMLYTLSKEERRKELKDVFQIKDNIEKIKNKSILLVDDIFTTGSTVNEISKELKLSGVSKIFVLSLLTRSNDSYVVE